MRSLNDDGDIHGVLVQLPLGPAVGPEGEREVTEAISPEKDVDGCVSRALKPILVLNTDPLGQVPCIQHRSPGIARCKPALRAMHACGLYRAARVDRRAHRRR